jgi:hypothetical protein
LGEGLRVDGLAVVADDESAFGVVVSEPFVVVVAPAGEAP